MVFCSLRWFCSLAQAAAADGRSYEQYVRQELLAKCGIDDEGACIENGAGVTSSRLLLEGRASSCSALGLRLGGVGPAIDRPTPRVFEGVHSFVPLTHL